VGMGCSFEIGYIQRSMNGTPNYLLGDHLDSLAAQKQCSQAVTASSSGMLSAEIRFYPWGT
jgi:hypothetical protein